MSLIEDSVCAKIQARAVLGLNKYGTTLERTDVSVLGWLTHAQEEAMDLASYLEKLMIELETQMKNASPDANPDVVKIRQDSKDVEISVGGLVKFAKALRKSTGLPKFAKAIPEQGYSDCTGCCLEGFCEENRQPLRCHSHARADKVGVIFVETTEGDLK